MSKYLETKKGSLEDMVAGVTEGKQSEDYKQLFKKELEKAGKGIGAMSDQEKKDFFNKIDKKHSAKNEDSKKVQKMNVKKASGEDSKKLKESVELEEGGVKDFLMDVEADAGDMSLNDLIRKYYGQMGLTAQDIKKIYYRVNESVNEEEIKEKDEFHLFDNKKDAEKKAKEIGGKVIDGTAYRAGHYAVYKGKKIKEEVEKETEEVKSLRDTVHDIWNQAAQDEEKREDDAKWLKTEEKKSITEEQIKCPNCGHMNDAGADKCSNCGYDLSKKEGKHEKKKAMTGSPATKVDTKPEVEFDGK